MITCNFYTYGLSLFGLLVIVHYLIRSLWGVLQAARTFLAPYFIQNEESMTLEKKFGSWALITGSTDGIGKAYAAELAKRGINVVLVSRSNDKLEKVAAEIEEKYSVKTKIIATDFTNGPKAVDIVKQELGDIPIGILVNNVGKNYEYPMYLNEVPEQELTDVININIMAVTMMCRAFIKDMKDRGKGAIVNVSSGAELQPLPFMTVYAASKAYIQSFTSALRYEYAGTGLTIQHLRPFFVNTKMNNFSDKYRTTSLTVPDSEMYAKYAVATLGKQDQSTGYWTHGIQNFFTEMAPVWCRLLIGAKMNENIRREYIAKHKLKST